MLGSLLLFAALGPLAETPCDHPVMLFPWWTDENGKQKVLPILGVIFERFEDRPFQTSYEGIVSAVTAATVTIDIPENTSAIIKTDPTGRVVGVVKVVTTARPQLVFGVGRALAEGKSGGKYDNDSYRLADVKIGDRISLWCSKPQLADSIIIHRRPGGKVPASPLSKPNDPRAWHVVTNAQQAKEEGRIAPPPRPVLPQIRQ